MRPKVFVEEGLANALNLYMEDDDIDALETEAEFWLSCDDCEVCDDRQMCSAHFERMYATL